jgi:hypothetical protein
MGTRALDHVLRHNAWANKTLLEFCAALEPAALDLSAAGTYGTLHGTLQHIVGGEQFYIRLLTGEVLGKPVRKTERRTLDDLIAIAALTGARAIDVAASDDVARVIAPGDDQTTAGSCWRSSCTTATSIARTRRPSSVRMTGRRPRSARGHMGSRTESRGMMGTR